MRLAAIMLQVVLTLCVTIGPVTERGRPTTTLRQPGPDVTTFEQADVPVGNNIVGLNVARLRKARYVYAAADLVNANGGDWGYLTVVFTADERDTAAGEQSLQELLDRCYEQHLQPIIRVATHFDVNTETWSRPEPDDAERWRAFLERGRWPTKQVWVIAGNEPNLGREWGGEVDSNTYAAYLAHFLDVFADSERFKVVNGPLDASNITEMPKMQDAYEFLAGMDAAVPGIFARLSGWASNPYSVPNQGPDLRYTHRAYEAELEAIGRDMPGADYRSRPPEYRRRPGDRGVLRASVSRLDGRSARRGRHAAVLASGSRRVLDVRLRPRQHRRRQEPDV